MTFLLRHCADEHLENFKVDSQSAGHKMVCMIPLTSKHKLVSLSLIFALFLVSAHAEIKVTPFGILDTEAAVKIRYNVETKNGVETQTETVEPQDVVNEEAIKKLAKKLSAQKFILTPGNTKSFKIKATFFRQARAEAKATPQALRVRRYQWVKSQIQYETRNFYKKNIPEAVAPLGSFINEYGGSMTLTNKEKKPIGTLIISYSTDVLPLANEETERKMFFPNSKVPLLKDAEFFIVKEIPSTWTSGNWEPCWPKSALRACSHYVLPSGENVLVKKEGKFYRCYGFVEKIEVTFRYDKLK